MKIINSTDNNLIKKFRSLSVKKYREQYALCVLEGKKMVLEALAHPGLVEYLIIESGKESVYNQYVDLLGDRAVIVSKEVFLSIAKAVTPQEVMAVINIKKPEKLSSDKNLLVLDHLQDPGNLGTIIRSAVASGHTEIVLINSVDPYNEKTLRSATGTIFKANFHNFSMQEFLDFKKTNSINCVIADMGGKNIFDSRFMISEPYALVIGSEGQGVSPEIRRICDSAVSIPMEMGVESLNAGVSASIIMFNLKNKG